MKYLLLIYTREAEMASMSAPALAEATAAYAAYAQAMGQAGILLGGERLQPIATATTLCTTDGKTQVLDGPYADTKEQLGGYFMIDVPDMDAALAWTARCPAVAKGAVEVRPIWTMNTESGRYE